MELTQTQINTLKQNLRNKRIRIELLDDEFKTISTIEGSVVNGEITANAENDIRYSGNLTIAIPTYVNKSNFLVELQDYTISANGKIWLDKRVRIHIGVDNFANGSTTWYNMGIYYIDKPVRTFSGTDYLVSFDIADQMLKLSGARQGQITGLSTTFEKGYYQLGQQPIEYGSDFSSGKLVFDTSFSGSFGTTSNTILTTSGGDEIKYIHGIQQEANVQGTVTASQGWNIVATREYNYSLVFARWTNYCLKLNTSGKVIASYPLNYDYTWMSAVYGNGVVVLVAANEGLFASQNTTQYGLYSSNNGATWTRFSFPEAHRWTKVIYSETKQRFFAIASDTLKVYSSTDGSTWSEYITISSGVTALSCMAEITSMNETNPRSYILFFSSGSDVVSYVYDTNTQGTFSIPTSASWSSASSSPIEVSTGLGNIIKQQGAVVVVANYSSDCYYLRIMDTDNNTTITPTWSRQSLGSSEGWNSVYATNYITQSGKNYSFVMVSSAYKAVCSRVKISSATFDEWNNLDFAEEARSESFTAQCITANRTSADNGYYIFLIGNNFIMKALADTTTPNYGDSLVLDVLDVTPSSIKGMVYADSKYAIILSDGTIVFYSSLATAKTMSSGVCPISGSIKGIVGLNNYVMVYSDTQAYYTSNSGQTWTSKSFSGTTLSKILSIQYINNKIMALGISNDGNNSLCLATSTSMTSAWTFSVIASPPVTSTSGARVFMGYANSRYVIMLSSLSTITTYSSTDLNTWTATEPSITSIMPVQSFAASSDKFVITTYESASVFSSNDGITWTQSTSSPVYVMGEPRIAFYDGIYILSINNKIYYSFDLVTWEFFADSKYRSGNLFMQVVNSNLYLVYPNRRVTQVLTSNGLFYNNTEIVKTNIPGGYIWYRSEINLPETSGYVDFVNNSSIENFRSFTDLYQQEYVKVKTEDALRSVITDLAGITKYSIYPIPKKYEYLPYDIKVGVGSTVLEILNKFKEILSTWQMYFDRASGYFIVEPIPSGENDIVYDIDERQLIQNDQDVDFQHVKNQVVIYGKLNSLTYYTDNETVAGSVIYSGTTLKLYYQGINSGALGIGSTLFGFKTPASYNSMINAVEIYNNNSLLCSGPLVDFEYVQSFVPENKMEPNEIYCIRIYNAGLNHDGSINLLQNMIFEFYSKQQVLWNLVNDNKASPFYVNNNIKETNYYCGLSRSVNGSAYELTLNDDTVTTSLPDKTILTFMANQLNTDGVTINVYSSFSDTAIVSNALIKQNYLTTSTTRPNLPAGKLYNDCTIHKIQYDATHNWFVYLGRNDKVITKVLSGGEYDNIYTDQLAYERCLYELYQYSNMQNTISLGLIPNYNLDVNKRIPYNEKFTNLDLEDYQNLVVQPDSNYIVLTDKQYKVQLEKEYYLTKSVTFPLGVNNTPQNVTAIKIYNDKNLVGDDYSYITSN